MSSKEIICVYQDCVMCGSKGQKLKEYIAEHGLKVRKVSFASPEGKGLSYKALTEHRGSVGKMPFYTDGERFAQNIQELVEKKAEDKPKRVRKYATRKRIKKIVEGKDESNS